MHAPRRCISLFSGAGGLDIGAHKAGFTTCLATDVNPKFCQTLRINKWLASASRDEFDSWFDATAPRWGRLAPESLKLMRKRLEAGIGEPNPLGGAAVVAEDIAALPSEDIMAISRSTRGGIDVVMGGPPCQSFSRAGARRSLDDERGRLFLEFARVVKDLMPRFVLFENVKGLADSRGRVVKARCATCGEFQPPYADAEILELEDRTSCPTCYGLAEVTEVNSRGHALNIVVNEFEQLGYKCYVALLDAADFGAPQRRQRLFVVGTRDGEKFTPPTPTHLAQTTGQLGLLAAHDAPRWASVWDALFSEPNPYHDWPLDPEVAQLWVKNVVRPHAEPVTWTLSRPSPTVGAHQGAKLAIAPYGVPEAQVRRQQWHVKGRRQGDSPPVPVHHSYLSDEDLLVLQSFPRHWALAGTRMERAFQIGNAVPPRLAEAVLSALPV